MPSAHAHGRKDVEMRRLVWILCLVSITTARSIVYPAQGDIERWREATKAKWLSRARTETGMEESVLTGHVSVGTFNAYLYRGTPGFEERKALLIETLQDREENYVPDILCLQEVYRRSDAKDVVGAVKEDYPYYASFQDLEEKPSVHRACTNKDLEAFMDCVNRCIEEGGCGLHTCEGVITFPCLNCIALEFRPSTLESLTYCLTIPLNEYTAPCGNLLLSRFPLSDVVTADFLDESYNSTLLPKTGYITAMIDDYMFFCTHLTAVYDAPVPYDGPPFFDSYKQQQANEVLVINQVLEGVEDVVLLGDFNHGPAIPGVQWQAPLLYGLMTANGYFSANVLWCGHCTYCLENSLASPLTVYDKIIDHIYLPVCKRSTIVRVDRIFDSIYTSGPTAYPLSDHYGVRAVLDFTKANGAVVQRIPEEGCRHPPHR